MSRQHLHWRSRAAQILLDVVDSMDYQATLSRSPRAVLLYGMGYVREMRDANERAEQRRELRRLKKKKLLKSQKIGCEILYQLTREGREEAFRLKVLHAGLLEDGNITIVVFDIPESQRVVRRQLRQLLTSAGFIPIQKSVWVSPFETAELLNKLFSIKNTKRWIRVFTAKENILSK